MKTLLCGLFALLFWMYIPLPLARADSFDESLAVVIPNCNNPLNCMTSKECSSPSSLMTDNIQEIEKTLLEASRLLEPEAEPNVLVLAEKKLYSSDPAMRLSSMRELQTLFDSKGNTIPAELKKRIGLRLTQLVYSDASTEVQVLASQMVANLRDLALLKTLIPLVSAQPPKELTKFFKPLDESSKKKIREIIIQGINNIDPVRVEQDKYLTAFMVEASNGKNHSSLQGQSKGNLSKNPKEVILLWNQYLQNASNDEAGNLSELAISIHSKLFNIDSIEDPEGLLQKQLLPSLIEKSNKHMNPSVRITALKLLSSLPRTYDNLKKIILTVNSRLSLDPSVDVKKFAVQLMGQLRSGAGISFSKEVLGGLTSTIWEEGQHKELKFEAVFSLIRASMATQTNDGYQALLNVFLNSKHIFADFSEEEVKKIWNEVEERYLPPYADSADVDMVRFLNSLSPKNNSGTVSKQISDLARDALTGIREASSSRSKDLSDEPSAAPSAGSEFMGGGYGGGFGLPPPGAGIGVVGGGIAWAPTLQTYTDTMSQALAKVKEPLPNGLVDLESRPGQAPWEQYNLLQYYVVALAQMESSLSADERALVNQPSYRSDLKKITEKLDQLASKMKGK